MVDLRKQVTMLQMEKDELTTQLELMTKTKQKVEQVVLQERKELEQFKNVHPQPASAEESDNAASLQA